MVTTPPTADHAVAARSTEVARFTSAVVGLNPTAAFAAIENVNEALLHVDAGQLKAFNDQLEQIVGGPSGMLNGKVTPQNFMTALQGSNNNPAFTLMLKNAVTAIGDQVAKLPSPPSAIPASFYNDTAHSLSELLPPPAPAVVASPSRGFSIDLIPSARADTLPTPLLPPSSLPNPSPSPVSPPAATTNPPATLVAPTPLPVPVMATTPDALASANVRLHPPTAAPASPPTILAGDTRVSLGPSAPTIPAVPIPAAPTVVPTPPPAIDIKYGLGQTGLGAHPADTIHSIDEGLKAYAQTTGPDRGQLKREIIVDASVDGTGTLAQNKKALDSRIHSEHALVAARLKELEKHGDLNGLKATDFTIIDKPAEIKLDGKADATRRVGHINFGPSSPH